MRRVSDHLRLLVVDDDPFTRATLIPALNAEGLEVSIESSTAADAMYQAARHPVDAAVIDLDLGEGPTGIDLAHALRRALPTIGIVIMSTYTDPGLVGPNLPPIPPGGRYLIKQQITQMGLLAEAVRASVDHEARAPVPNAAPTSPLTEGQRDILRLVASGYSNREIARRRVVEEATIEKSIARLIRQLGITVDPDQNPRVLLTRAYHQLSGGQDARP